MKLFRHVTSWLVLFCFVLTTSAPLRAQSLGKSSSEDDQRRQSEQVLRERGSSFGSAGEKKQERPYIPGDARTESGGGQFGVLTYQIHVLGEVERPGTYRLPASTRLSEAVERAGGILEKGSERRIQLRRGEGRGRIVDLLAFKQKGSLDNNPYLMDNDVVFVPFRERVVQIEGAVKRPGAYELKKEQTVQDLIRLVGGMTPGAEGIQDIKVVRHTNGVREVLNVANQSSELSRFRLENADVVVVPHILTDQKTFDYKVSRLPGDNPLFYPSYDERVFVLGGVSVPGPYPFSPYYSVRHYLTLAGGLNKLAKPKKVKIITSEGKTKKVNEATEVNPGDTIVIPEKYMAPESLVTLIVGISSTIVGITATVLSLTR